MIARAALRTLLALLTLVSFAAADRAQAFSDVFVFGDSLSDAGALNFLSPGDCPPAPYFDCRFSNGPVWAELLAADLGNSAVTAYGGAGTNYAIGGQRSDEILNGQIPLFSSHVAGAADSDALYIVWGGGNDFLQGIDAVTAATNILSSVQALSALGATNFLVPNLPVSDATYAVTFHNTLSAGLDSLTGVNAQLLPVLALLFQVNLNPGAFGFTNVTDPCVDLGAGTVCANPDEYLFWDAVHPTARAHELIAAEALALVPEPGTGLLLGLGLGVLARTRRSVAAA